MKRIMIIGSPGSGKSTAARLIGDRLGLPVVHIDREVYWLPGWVERDRAEQEARVTQIIAQEAWVFEGSMSRTFAQREARAEMLIWLDTPLWLRLIRVVRRSAMQRGQTRPDLAEDCPEQLRNLPSFLWFILRTSAQAHRKQAALYHGSSLPKHRLRRAAAVNRFAKALAEDD